MREQVLSIKGAHRIYFVDFVHNADTLSSFCLENDCFFILFNTSAYPLSYLLPLCYPVDENAFFLLYQNSRMFLLFFSSHLDLLLLFYLVEGIAKSVVSGGEDVETNPLSNPSQSLQYLYANPPSYNLQQHQPPPTTTANPKTI